MCRQHGYNSPKSSAASACAFTCRLHHQPPPLLRLSKVPETQIMFLKISKTGRCSKTTNSKRRICNIGDYWLLLLKFIVIKLMAPSFRLRVLGLCKICSIFHREPSNQITNTILYPCERPELNFHVLKFLGNKAAYTFKRMLL